MNKVSFAFSWLRDRYANKLREIHAYKYLQTKIQNMLNFNSTIPFEEAQQSQLTIKDHQMYVQDVELKRWLGSQSGVCLVEGKMTTIHGFGDNIGQVEVDSNEMKCLKGDLYILSSGRHTLSALSNIFIKAPVLQYSAEPSCQLISGPVNYFTADKMPIVGLSSRYHNLILNFGLQCSEDQLNWQVAQSEIVAAKALEVLGLSDKKVEVDPLIDCKRFNM